MLVSAAVCPHPPVLVPAVAGRAAPELDACREASLEAVADLADASPDLLVVVGAGAGTTSFEGGTAGSLRSFGVDVRTAVRGGRPASDVPAVLPLSLTVAGWLLGTAGWAADVRGLQVDADLPPRECVALGATLADLAPRVAALVMADLSARRSAGAPGYLDPRSVPFDEAVERAVAAGDTATLGTLDPVLADELLVGGRAPLQVLAGMGPLGAGRVRYADDPYGVRYVVASWTPAG